MVLMGFKKGKGPKTPKRARTLMEKAYEKAQPNSKYYKDKADALFSDIIRSIGYCQICLKQGRERKDGLKVLGLHVHHLIERAQIGYRFNIQNGVSVCVACHGSMPMYRNKVANFHGTQEQRDNTLERLKKMCPEKYNWYMENKGIKKRTMEVSYKFVYDLLKETYCSK